ncbi:MAG: hypothetical protein CR989_00260 [Flavobacteriales bacterium]|nr:MAG: hypothetical protein CR989_00260 [Flavobacteriales bacterium]
MQTFIQDVLAALSERNINYTEITFVLPGKRAGVFLKNELKQQLSGETVVLPEILSIEDFITELSELKKIDYTQLLFEFYTIYKRTTPKENLESFYEFSKWAGMLLQDFNEIDKQQLDANDIFDYITDAKRIEKLLSPHSTTEFIDTQVKFFERLKVYYKELNKHLLNKQLGYQGQLYREAVRNKQHYINSAPNLVVFAGFNALNKSEEDIIRALLDHQLAEIYWDIDSFFYKKEHNVSRFIKEYAKKWSYYKSNPLSFVQNHFSNKKHIKIIGTPKTVLQAKCAGELLEHTISHKNNYADTALILLDESLIEPVLYSLPESLDKINITMGYPLAYVPLAALYENLFLLYKTKSNKAFYYKYVTAVLNNNFVRKIYSNPNAVDSLIEKILKYNFNYLTIKKLEELIDDADLFEKTAFLFRVPEDDISSLINICLRLTEYIKDSDINSIEKEYLYRFYTVLKQLNTLQQDYGYIEDYGSLYQLYRDILRNETINFKGEPLSGLQIMGMLETRLLDFKNVIITNANEGILPTGKTNQSFIPFDIKREKNLPTYIEKDAIFAYHFFRLIQRAENVYILYNTQPNDYGSGEQSRFVTQLELYKPNEVIKQIVSTPTATEQITLQEINKDRTLRESLKNLANMGLSPTTLTNYILNPIVFYKQKILKINEREELEETVDSSTLGNIVHQSLEELYSPFIDKFLRVQNIEDMISTADEVVEKWFDEEYKNGNIATGENLLIFNVAKQFVKNFLRSEKNSIKDNNSIKILALEREMQTVIHIKDLPFPIILKGTADRIDQINGVTRIIDYKTGKVQQKDVKIKDNNALITDYKEQSKAFQVLFYAYLYVQLESINLENTPFETGIISFKNLQSGFLKLNNSLLDKVTLSIFETQLEQLLSEIFSPAIAFIEKESPF